MRKITLVITILVSILLIPLPLYARGGHGGGHGGFGGHGFGGHTSFGHGGFHSGFGGHGFGGFGHGGFHTGHFGHGHFFGHHHHGHFFPSFFLGVGFGALALSPFVIYPYYPYPYPYYVYPYASYPPTAQSYGDLEIQVAPEEVEIYVDGRFIGLARDFKGPAIVSVPSGSHVVEFRYGGSSSSNTVYVSPGSVSVVSGEFKPVPGSSKEFFTPPSYRYFPTVYLEESAGLLKLKAEPDSAVIYINGKSLATANQIENGVIALPAGSHNIRIAAEGYSSYEGKVNIPENDKTELRVHLEKGPRDKVSSLYEH
ncbi:MAG: PEGA domain-containing protein [Deltaproteobacteria bacterium]|nr:PEGA domain-containing protein [Deltaproteobacteria bacterium]